MVPAILEISPVKTVPKSKQLNKVKDKNDKNQTDLFESQDWHFEKIAAEKRLFFWITDQVMHSLA